MTPPRLQIASLFASYAIAGVFWGALAASAPALQARAGLDAAGFGLALGVMSLTAFPVMFAFGRVVGRVARHAIPGAMATFAAGCLGLAAAGDSLWVLVAALAVLGGSSGALDIALNLRTARIEEDTGARLFNRTHAVFPMAMLAASAGTGWLRAVGAGVADIFPAIAAGLILMAATEARAGRHQAAAAPDPGRPRPRLALATLLIGAVAALGAFQEAAPLAWAAIFVETVRDAGAAAAGLAPAAFTLGLSLGRLAAHELEDRLTPMATVRLAALFSAPAFFALALPGPAALGLALFLIAGMGVGPVEPAVFRAVARRSDAAHRGPMLATVTSVAYVGYLVSPPVLGSVADGFGWAALWGTAAAASAGVAALTFTLRRV